MLQFIFQLLFPIVWGAGENRVYREGTEMVTSHFKLYHVWMFTLFLFVTCSPSLLLWTWLMVWSFLMLDVTWWVIRYFDFQNHPDEAIGWYNGETNAWHEQSDWDNYGGLPLWAGVYWWWWIFMIILMVLGIAGLYWWCFPLTTLNTI
jgi:hypothetical protein